MNNAKIKRLTTSAMFLAMGILLPQVFHIAGGSMSGKIFLPMHIPTLLCGFVCGPFWAGAVGFVCPLLSSAITGMPEMFPQGISQMGEMLVYGAVSGAVSHYLMKNKGTLLNVYVSLISAMICGRIVSGIIKYLLLIPTANPLTWKAFIGAAVITSWPGIVIQLVIIPIIVAVIKKIGKKAI